VCLWGGLQEEQAQAMRAEESLMFSSSIKIVLLERRMWSIQSQLKILKMIKCVNATASGVRVKVVS
jgi:hypothetical protein